MAIRNKNLYDLACEENKKELGNNKQKGMEVKNMGHLSHVILGLNPSFSPSPSLLLPNYYQLQYYHLQNGTNYSVIKRT